MLRAHISTLIEDPQIGYPSMYKENPYETCVRLPWLALDPYHGKAMFPNASLAID